MMRLGRELRVVLGFCFLAFAVFGANAAQAAPTWMAEGLALTSGTVALKGETVAGMTTTTKIGGNEVKFTCKKGELKEFEAEKEGKIKEGGTIRFSECTTAINGSTQKPCEPKNGGKEAGVIVFNKVKGHLAEHSTGEGVLTLETTVKEKIEGKEVPVLGHVDMSEECSIGEDLPLIGGKLGLVDSGGMTGLLTEAKSHKLKEGPLTEVWAISETTEHKVTCTGEWSVSLVVGLNWGALL